MRQVKDFFRATAEEPLFHYTGIDSLVGIGTTGVMWASHVYYLNDSKEILHACDVLQEALTPRLVFGALTKSEREFADQFQSWAKSFYREKYCLFVLSLSEVPSLLSQWRSYTPHGKGVSLELGPEAINRIMSLNQLRIARCLYERTEQEEVLASLFDKLLSTFRQLSPVPSAKANPPETSYYEFLEQFRGDVLQVLSIIKHGAFKEEREWRLISPYFPSYTVKPIKFRVGASLLVPYIELELGNQRPVFDRVILGPTPHADLSMAALSMYLSNSRLSNGTSNSQIPYRKW